MRELLLHALHPTNFASGDLLHVLHDLRQRMMVGGDCNRSVALELIISIEGQFPLNNNLDVFRIRSGRQLEFRPFSDIFSKLPSFPSPKTVTNEKKKQNLHLKR